MRKSLVFLLTIFVCALGSATTSAQSSSTTGEASEGSNTNLLSASDLVGQISDARRLLSSRPTSGLAPDRVTLAAFDSETLQTIVVLLP